MLQIYNSLTRTKEPLVTIHPGKVGIYVCGITVYDRCHLGHARSMVAFDVVVRYLRAQGYQVHFVRNITDIDDKIIDRANQQGVSIHELTQKYIAAMNDDAKALGVLSPDQEPCATEHVQEIIDLIQKLIDKKYAYISDNGDICYQVGKFKDYGKLSHKDLEGLLSGARVEVVKEKKSPLDFVLWKKAKEHEPSWPSPWGMGRPGWHIECSAMAMNMLGEQFDIHGGGLDLQFPHHENEIAQSEAATDKPFANYWMHAGLLQVNGEKMSKSLGNFLTIEDVLKVHHPEVVRYFLLSSHYRSSLNYSEDNIINARKALTRLYQAITGIESCSDFECLDKRWIASFEQAMNDDFNTPEGLAVLFQLAHEINKTNNKSLGHTLRHLARILGLLQEAPQAFLQSGISEIDKEDIERFIAERIQARADKNWMRADEIRQELLERGVELLDGPEGTTWRHTARDY